VAEDVLPPSSDAAGVARLEAQLAEIDTALPGGGLVGCVKRRCCCRCCCCDYYTIRTPAAAPLLFLLTPLHSLSPSHSPSHSLSSPPTYY